MTQRQTTRLAFLAGLLLAAGVFVAWQLWRPSEQARFESIAAALDRREIERARTELAGWRSAGGGGPGPDLLEGMLALREGKPDAALAIFSELKPDPPYRERLLQVTGECLHRMGRLAEAKGCLVPLAR